MYRMNDSVKLLIISLACSAFALTADTLSLHSRLVVAVCGVGFALAAFDLAVIHRDENQADDESEYVPPRDRLGL